MNKIKICTDSTSDLDKETLKKYNINMVPLSVHFGERSYKDKIDLSTEEFYKMLQTDPDHPKTSQPTPENFKAAFIAAEGWGTFSQKRQPNMQTELLRLQWGQLTLKQMAFDLPAGKTARMVQVTVKSNEVKVTHRMTKNRVIVTLAESVKIQAGQDIKVQIQQ